MTNPRLQTVCAALEIDMIEQLHSLARAEDRSLSAIIRRLLTQALSETIVARTDEEFLQRVATTETDELDDVVPAARRTRPLA